MKTSACVPNVSSDYFWHGTVVSANSTARPPPIVDSSWSQTMVLALLSCFTTQLSPCLGLQSWVYSVNRRDPEHWEWRKREHVLVCLCGNSKFGIQLYVGAGDHNIGRCCYLCGVWEERSWPPHWIWFDKPLKIDLDNFTSVPHLVCWRLFQTLSCFGPWTNLLCQGSTIAVNYPATLINGLNLSSAFL